MVKWGEFLGGKYKGVKRTPKKVEPVVKAEEVKNEVKEVKPQEGMKKGEVKVLDASDRRIKNMFGL